MTFTEPTDHPRRILLAVTGLSPQVITETLYALAVAATSPWVPTEIHLITTLKGADHARLNLLSGHPGWFHQLCKDYALPEIRFDAGHIHVVCDRHGQPLDDIRTPRDNEQAADFIAEIMRDLTSDPTSALHVSIAGGRKTMGFFVGYALSLYGRPQDRLSHVLVSAPFESHPEFYYPTPNERVIHTLDRQSLALACRRAQVTLAEIPFVRLRHGLPKDLLAGRAHFSASVAAASRALGPSELVIDLQTRQVRAGAITFPLPPADLAFYAWFARQRQAGQAPLAGLSEKDPEGLSRQYQRDYLHEYRLIDPSGDEGRVARRLKYGMDRQFFDERNAKLNKKLTAALGSVAAAPYLIVGEGRRPRRYALPLDTSAIRFDRVAQPEHVVKEAIS